jgi:hypothetical protein
MIIEENTVCYTSEIGHNNFLYPTTNKVMVKENCEVSSPAWLGGGNKIPIKILKSKLIPLNIAENTTKNTSPPTKNDYTIVWIEKQNLRNTKEI